MDIISSSLSIRKKCGNLVKSSLKSIINQRNFYPVAPAQKSPVDLSKIHMMDIKADNIPEPDVLLVNSQITSFAEDIEGVVCVNTGPSIKTNKFRHFGLISVDFEELCNDKKGRDTREFIKVEIKEF